MRHNACIKSRYAPVTLVVIISEKVVITIIITASAKCSGTYSFRPSLQGIDHQDLNQARRFQTWPKRTCFVAVKLWSLRKPNVDVRGKQAFDRKAVAAALWISSSVEVPQNQFVILASEPIQRAFSRGVTNYYFTKGNSDGLWRLTFKSWTDCSNENRSSLVIFRELQNV